MVTNNVDDPWFWTVGRVCQELTTNNRSWTPSALSSPNLDNLRQKLQQHGVTGHMLLTFDFNRRYLSLTFNIYVVNQQSWFLNAIGQFRARSPQYSATHIPPITQDQTIQQLLQAYATFRAYLQTLPEYQNHPQLQPGSQLGFPALPALPIAALLPGVVANPPVAPLPFPAVTVPAVESNSPQNISPVISALNVDGEQRDAAEGEASGTQESDEPAAKRHKSDSAAPASDSAPLFANGTQEDAAYPHSENVAPSPEPSTQDPESSIEPVESAAENHTHGSSAQSHASLSLENNVEILNADSAHADESINQLSTPMLPEATSAVPPVQDDGNVSAAQSKVEPPKQPKRLALGMLTHVGEIDPYRNRAVPTYEDDILGLDIPDSSTLNQKRVAPQLLPVDSEVYAKSAWAMSDGEDIGSEQSDVEAADQEGFEPSEHPVILGTVLPTPQPVTQTRCRRTRAAKYLQRKKFTVDDIFYGKVPFGADLPVDTIEPEDKYFSHTKLRQLPPGQVQYVGKMMRNFMLSKQDLNRRPRVLGPKFSTTLLAVDVSRDADGKHIPPVPFDWEAYFANGVWEDIVPESDEEPKKAPNHELPSRELRVVSAATSEQEPTPLFAVPAVASKTTHSGDGISEEQVVDDKVYTRFTAVRTYPEGNGKITFMNLLSTPSFTLYYTTPEGKICARREKLVDWPELMGNQDPKNFVAYNPLQLIGRNLDSCNPYAEPDALRHWVTSRRGRKELPLWGESGNEGCYDSATWREIDEERAEIRRRRTGQPLTRLNPIQLHNIWNQAISDYTQKWHQEKLPKLEKTAAGIWLGSRRTRTKRIQVKAAQNDIQTLQIRLANLHAEWSSVHWVNLGQAARGCRNIEYTVFGIKTLEWTIDTLQQQTSPGIPFVRPSKRVSRPKIEGPRASEAEDTIDDGMGDFITDDDEAFDAEGSEEEEMVDNMEDSEDELVEGDRPTQAQRTLNSSTENPSTPVRKSHSTKRTSEIIDLTDSPPSGPIDLVTPEKTSPAMPKVPKVKLMNRSISPLAISSDSDVELPPFNNPMAIAEFPYEFWQKARDTERLLIRVFYKLRNPQHILSLFAHCNEEKLWELMCQVIRALKVGNEEVDRMTSTDFDRLYAIAQILAMYMECKFTEWGREMSKGFCNVLLNAKGWWHSFYKHCSRMEKFLDGSYVSEPGSPLLLSNFANLKPMKRQHLESDDDDEGPTKRRRIRDSTTASEDIPEQLSPNMKRKRPVAEDLNARNLRTRNHERLAEQEKRRRVLKAALAQSGHTFGTGKAKYIINDAAALDQGHVYVNEDIASSIKPHQVEGVRFMWNQVIPGADDASSQGCLLAHTMGLGKTMQVITLLVAIEAAASSPDPSVSSQIPSCLKGNTRTLILCPPGLIDNWWDECLRWAPENSSNGTVLGGLYKVSSALSIAERLQEIYAWHEAGGVLIMGYEMLRSLVQNKEKTNSVAPLTKNEHDQVLEQLLRGPDMIVADEAHKMKNAKSGLAVAASQFKSTRRIALTGSPLANNVEEYHSMIDFVAPNYLGSVVEFRAHYKEPIEVCLILLTEPPSLNLVSLQLTFAS